MARSRPPPLASDLERRPDQDLAGARPRRGTVADSSEPKLLRLNLGCGASPTEGWQNFDNSLTVRLTHPHWLWRLLLKTGQVSPERKIFGEAAIRGGIRWADITKGIPASTGSAQAIYSSHTFEHLDRGEAEAFLKDCFRVLAPGGVLRLVVPDLERLVERYRATGDADQLIAATLLAHPRPKTLAERLRYEVVGDRDHFWMYDATSLTKLLRRHGFEPVRTLPPGSTTLPLPGSLNLREREDESVYVEATRP